MVIRTARDKAAALLLAYWSGKLSSDDLITDWPLDRRDAILTELDDLWSTNDESDPAFITEQVRSIPYNASFVRRVLLFLKSDREYEWRKLGTQSSSNPVMQLLQLGILSHKVKDKLRLGDYEEWPFFCKEDYVNTAKEIWPEGPPQILS